MTPDENVEMKGAKAAVRVPTREERERDHANSDSYYNYNALECIRKYIAALAHVEAEWDGLWTLISEIREPIKRCFIDRIMIFARFQSVAVRWYERVVGEGHPDTLRADRDRLASALADAGRELEKIKGERDTLREIVEMFEGFHGGRMPHMEFVKRFGMQPDKLATLETILTKARTALEAKS